MERRRLCSSCRHISHRRGDGACRAVPPQFTNGTKSHNAQHESTILIPVAETSHLGSIFQHVSCSEVVFGGSLKVSGTAPMVAAEYDVVHRELVNVRLADGTPSGPR